MVNYSTHPKTFDEVLRSAREQAARTDEMGGSLPYNECVTLTAETFFDVCAVVADLRRRLVALEESSCFRP